MKIKANELKDWCNINLTPLAWQRVVLRALPRLESVGISMIDLENPGAGFVLQGNVLQIMLDTIESMYHVSVPQTIFV